MKSTFLKLVIACSSSLILTENIDLSPLWNSLLTLVISIISVLSVDGINWLRAKIREKTNKKQLDEKEKENDR